MGGPILLVDDDIFGPLTSTASGMLAGLDIAIATQPEAQKSPRREQPGGFSTLRAILLAVLLAATQRQAAENDQVKNHL